MFIEQKRHPIHSNAVERKRINTLKIGKRCKMYLRLAKCIWAQQILRTNTGHDPFGKYEWMQNFGTFSKLS